MEYISKKQLLDYLERVVVCNDIKDTTQQVRKTTYKNTNLYDFVQGMETINFIKDK